MSRRRDAAEASGRALRGSDAVVVVVDAVVVVGENGCDEESEVGFRRLRLRSLTGFLSALREVLREKKALIGE